MSYFVLVNLVNMNLVFHISENGSEIELYAFFVAASLFLRFLVYFLFNFEDNPVKSFEEVVPSQVRLTRL